MKIKFSTLTIDSDVLQLWKEFDISGKEKATVHVCSEICYFKCAKNFEDLQSIWINCGYLVWLELMLYMWFFKRKYDVSVFYL